MYQTTHTLQTLLNQTQVLQVYDRNNQPLSISYQNRLNQYDNLPLYQIPSFLQTAFIASEDRYFFQHHGVNWKSRWRALAQNIRSQQIVSGASSITEQIVRIIQPRPRNLWSKWLEGFDAYALELKFSKPALFEFYLNQVPYTANRRGVLQAARYYFDRDLSSLSHKEMLALVVLARAPSSFDLYRNPIKLNSAINRLANYLYQQNVLSSDQVKQIQIETFQLQKPQLPVNATHFVDYIRKQPLPFNSNLLRTTLDANLQQKTQALLESRLKSLTAQKVHNGAVLVVDHITGEILVWAVAGESNQINSVLTVRQPGSTLKPFLYALALEKGWTAASLIEDAPLQEAIGTGLHHFRNYSRGYYGQVTLREALGNSLNIPAVHTIQFVGVKPFFNLLHQLGFTSLQQSVGYYDLGLALGDGEVSLLELVRAYSALANDGVYKTLKTRLDQGQRQTIRTVLSPTSTSLIANILSDPWARQAEFGMDNILNFPVQTAVKTGTSSDYHDAWAIGFNYRYTVGVWFGNLDQKPMEGMTGAMGPAMVLRSVFAELNRHQVTQSLFLSPQLISKEVCVPEIIWHINWQNTSQMACHLRTEYFLPGHVPEWITPPPMHTAIKLVKPVEGLRFAIDPRIPLDKQAFEFVVEGTQTDNKVHWFIDQQPVVITTEGNYLWSVKGSGSHQMRVEIYRKDKLIYQSPKVSFWVRD